MIHALYQLLTRLGYDHPIHPLLVHITIGLTVATFTFGLVSVIFRRPRLKLTAWHTAVLATISVVPTALIGYGDWHEKMHGQPMTVITIKIILAISLFVVLFVSLFFGRGGEGETDPAARPWRNPRAIVALCLYGVCFGIVTALGYFGASLVY
ncbi:MAG TPA: DUF2231 domain-containing protein [Spirochaetia bacterium]|nr:DUF2231 domain-containing protein [Spirochaetia bacterium]